MPEKAKEELYQALEDQAIFFYKKLNIDNTKELVNEIVKPVEYHQPVPASARRATTWAWPTWAAFAHQVSLTKAFGKRINTDDFLGGAQRKTAFRRVRFCAWAG